MQDEPTPIELTKAVADFLRNDITPLISGHQAFKLRVAINILDLVTRQLTREAGSDAAEVERLRSLLGEDGTVMELNRALAERITKGEVDLATPGLADHLWATTMDKLAVASRRVRAERGPMTGSAKQSRVFRHGQSGLLRRKSSAQWRAKGPVYFPTHFGGRFSENAFGPSI